MSYRESIAAATGSRPSKAIGLFFDQFMLPGEPVTAALRGNTRMMPTWAVATPAIIAVVRDGAKPSLEAVATPADGVGWQAQPGWADAKLFLDLGGAEVTLGQVDAQRLGRFVNRLEYLFNSLVDSFPPLLFDVLARVESAHENASRAAPLREPAELNAVVAFDIYQALTGTVNQFEDLTFELSHLIFLTGLSNPASRNMGRRDVVISSVLTRQSIQPGDLALVRAMERTTDPRKRDSWRLAVLALSDALASARSLLAPGSKEARASLFRLATELKNVAGTAATASADRVEPVEEPNSRVETGGSDLVGTLERLHALRTSGALTEAEYEELKRKALDR